MQIFLLLGLFTFANTALPGNFPELPEYFQRIDNTRRFIREDNQRSGKTIIKIKKAIDECLLFKGMFEELLLEEENRDYKVTVNEKYANACVFRDYPYPNFVKTDGEETSSGFTILKEEQVFATNRLVYLKNLENKILKATLFYFEHVNILLGEKED
jgi:hypothetical protein